jgi:endonuclease YncB( thermonuclease family)
VGVSVAAVLLAAGLAITSVSAHPALADIAGPATVTHGDSIEVGGEPIRIIGIDAPEAQQLCQRDGEPWKCGRRATRALRSWIGLRPVSCRQLGRDRGRRIVAACAVGGRDVGEWMLHSGWAVTYEGYSYEYSRAENFAKMGRRGIWAGEFDNPWLWRMQRD